MYGRRYASHSSGITRAMAAEAAAPRAPQVRPVIILTQTSETLTGVAWVRGEQMSRDALYRDVLAARNAYAAGTNTRVFTDTVVLHDGPTVNAVNYSDIKRISEAQ